MVNSYNKKILAPRGRGSRRGSARSLPNFDENAPPAPIKARRNLPNRGYGYREVLEPDDVVAKLVEKRIEALGGGSHKNCIQVRSDIEEKLFDEEEKTSPRESAIEQYTAMLSYVDVKIEALEGKVKKENDPEAFEI